MNTQFELGPEQKEALKLIKDFIESDDRVFVLKGSAGTGKSLMLQYIIKHLNASYLSYCLCAPTHKAALVMETYTKIKAKTLHSLLAMSPNLDILRLNFRELQFKSGESKDIPYNGVVICDEASMINDDLFDFLCKRCEDYNAQIIFTGDFNQLQPVKQTQKSKVSTVKNQFTLTKIYRQDNDSALTDILADLRNEPYSKFTTKESPNGSIICTDNVAKFMKPAVELYKNTVATKDIMQTKILAYTNKRVDAYNKFIHKHIFEGENQYNKFEFLTCYSNMDRNYMSYWNSMDYVIVEEPERIDIDIPKFDVVPGFKLSLYDSLTKEIGTVKIIDKEFEGYNRLAAVIESLRMEAVEETARHLKRLLWQDYYKTIGSFVSPVDLEFDGRLVYKKGFDYGYATTVHKSQGSSINTVFIDMEDIFKQTNKEELRQLQYVALSRTRKDAYLYI